MLCRLSPKEVLMKELLILLLVILPTSSVHSQEVQEDIKQAIGNWYSKSAPRRPLTWNISQFGQGSPSKELIDKYNPKQTYCVNCKITVMPLPLRRVRVIAPYGAPPKYEEVEEITPQQPKTLSDNHIAIITQSGEIELINNYITADKVAPPPPMPRRAGSAPLPINGGENKFQSLWRKTCPFPFE
jgi:hypothetical protein